MKLKNSVFLIASIIGIPTIAQAGSVDFFAQKGQSYPAIVVKYAKTSERNFRTLAPNNLFDQNGKLLVPEKLFKAKTQTRSLNTDDDPNGLQRYYHIRISTDKQSDSVYINNLLKSLAKQPEVELVYPASDPVPLSNGVSQKLAASTRSAASPTTEKTPDFTSQQGYLNAPTYLTTPSYTLGGINWQNVRYKVGARGENITVISAETDRWNINHSDLPTSYRNFGTETKIDYHDTSSVGIMGAKDNGFGVTGIANQARFGHLFARHYDTSLPSIIEAGDALQAGDVVQIGMQVGATGITNCSKTCYVPIEYQPAWYDAIKTLTDKGIIVIQAAGNGNVNLDSPDFKKKFDVSNRDSGAIIAGAVCATDGKKASFSSYGKRVTSASWGCWDVVSTTTNNVAVDLYNGGDNDQYTKSFAGTSSANPIIAGAAASLSGYAKARRLTLTPREVRTILASTGTSLKGSDGRTSDSAVIGTQPDLVRAFASVDQKLRGVGINPAIKRR
ncbi:S8 family serine peptidase [Acinetobacter stercoris]|uniref:Calcium-dependent protease n=1 Tax=Acinetobacter stercoris TaxID=2126983 RepID=A0A2U3N4H9_9GAMM|nr:S8 family serine peptidase [Acinetobacter stercoris]SPL72563.1 Calcium-dependent protease precursor [Acinetobacter stercoris]